MKRVILAAIVSLAAVCAISAQEVKNDNVFRIGIIGTTTSHVPAAVNLINDNPDGDALFKGFKITAAYKGGMPDNPDSWGRVEKYADECKAKGIEIYGTIEEMLEQVDGVMLESVDGRPHLEQAKPVLAAKKPLFIDKPLGGSLADVLEIYRLADEAGLEIFSASSLRYAAETQKMRNEKPLGAILGVDAASPCSLNDKHPDFYWYGVHGVETLFTLMGAGCESVSRTQTADNEFAVGVWEGGRIGTFRGLRKSYAYNAAVFCEKGVASCGNYDGYKPLFVEVCNYFASGKSPIPAQETKEIFAFMSAADASKKAGGAPVKIADMMQNAANEKQTNITLALTKEGAAAWNGEQIAIDAISEKVAEAAADGAVVRVILDNRAGCDFAVVEQVLAELDQAYLANYLY